MYNIRYEIGLNEQGRPCIELPEDYEQRPEDRFFVMEVTRYILQDLLNRRSDDIDMETATAIDETERLLGQLGDEVAEILFEKMKLDKRMAEKLIGLFRTQNMAIYALPHKYGWMGHVMFIDTRENAHWTHPPVDSYEDAIDQAIEYALTRIVKYD